MDTSWVRPIVFHQETKDWLASLQWPATAYEDFDQIRKSWPSGTVVTASCPRGQSRCIAHGKSAQFPAVGSFCWTA